MALLDVKNLFTQFKTQDGIVRAVSGASFHVDRGEMIAIVGESGCGKTVSSLSILRLIPEPPGKIVSGEILFEDKDLLKLPKQEMYKIRGGQIAMIFQEPMTSLNPVLTIGRQLSEALELHRNMSKREALTEAAYLLKQVGISQPERRLKSYPHHFSGGMRQRVMIAMALITHPELLIADEPTTALDVTVQAQILELIKKFQRETGMAVIFVTHDLGVVSGLCDRVLVMYAGRVVESTDTRTLFRTPRHPYTRALQRSIPGLQPKGAELYTIPGLPPDLSKPHPGCAFAPRCEAAADACHATDPQLAALTPGHATACLRVQAGEI